MNSKGISEKTIEHIESSIECKINLDNVSGLMNYSKFHFHRLFLSEMGISVTDYIRKRRIAYSSYALKTTELSIINIAMTNGFNNVDTFIRNFKIYYGITPSQYRKLSINSIKISEKECVDRMKNEYKSIKKCSKDEKLNAICTVERMVELSKLAHNKGLLSIESVIKNDDSMFLKKAIELLLKGTEYSKLEKILTNYISLSSLSDYELLLRVIELEGVLLLHEGAYPWDVRIELFSYFGIDFISELEKRYNYDDELEEFINKEPLEVDNNRFIKKIENMNERSLQRVFRECDIVIIAISLMSLKKIYKEKIIESLPLGQKRILSEVVNSLGKINVNQIVDANNEIISVIQRLRLSSDID